MKPNISIASRLIFKRVIIFQNVVQKTNDLCYVAQSLINALLYVTEKNMNKETATKSSTVLQKQHYFLNDAS